MIENGLVDFLGSGPISEAHDQTGFALRRLGNFRNLQSFDGELADPFPDIIMDRNGIARSIAFSRTYQEVGMSGFILHKLGRMDRRTSFHRR